MLHHHWNTDDVDHARRFDYYRSGLCAAFAHLTPQPDDRTAHFHASLKTWKTAEQEVSMLSTTSHAVSRTTRDVSAVQDDHIYLNYIVRGEMMLCQGALHARLGSGSLVLIDNAKPFDVNIDADKGHCHLTLKMRCAAVTSSSSPTPIALAAHPLAPMLKSSLAFFSTRVAQGKLDYVPAMIASISTLADAMLAGGGSAGTESRSKVTLERVIALIEENYRDQGFDLDAALRVLGISRRTLQQHLQLHGNSFSALLRQRRLQSAYREALARSPGQSIENICYRNGLGELSSFYRAFKGQFGCTPASLC